MKINLTAEVGGKTLQIETGRLAKQASGAVLVTYGKTAVLVTVVAAKDSKESDFLPLSVEYQEKIYAAGRIPGNYFRREIGRPSEKETLTSRLIDRPIRPVFPKGYSYETQIIATVLSMDKENDPDILAMVGASAALEISDIPFEGPIAGIRVGRIGGELVTNPTLAEQEKCDINIIIAGSKTGVVMVEGGSSFVSEAEILDAILFGHAQMQPLIDVQLELKKVAGKAKREFSEPVQDADLVQKLNSVAETPLRKAMAVEGKTNRNMALREVKAQLIEDLGEEYADRKTEISEIIKDIQGQIMRSDILEKGIRIDGRKLNEIRSIACETSLLPQTHGSALFTRGETQVLNVLTLGSGTDEQRIETLSGEEARSFMLHYNFPPFSVGEVKRLGGPSRRDMGHGGLAHRALEKILPSKENFDYTIRLVSEVLESNGSSSMGTVCSGSLALMDGGVPVTGAVAGIAMGLIKEGDQIAVLSDILGDEDHAGDMDFKVAGTKEGITALQMDIKIKELTKEILEKALNQAREGRLHILDKMNEALSVSKTDISPLAPKIIRIQINPDKIRDIIGPGGKIIRAIQAETNTKIEIDDDGIVKIAATNETEGQVALKQIQDITREAEVGIIYDGVVVKTTDFGAFVNILPGVDGLCHISQLTTTRVKEVSDFIHVGDPLRVKVLEVSKDGKIRLSHRVLLEEDSAGSENTKNNSE